MSPNFSAWEKQIPGRDRVTKCSRSQFSAVELIHLSPDPVALSICSSHAKCFTWFCTYQAPWLYYHYSWYVFLRYTWFIQDVNLPTSQVHRCQGKCYNIACNNIASVDSLIFALKLSMWRTWWDHVNYLSVKTVSRNVNSSGFVQ